MTEEDDLEFENAEETPVGSPYHYKTSILNTVVQYCILLSQNTPMPKAKAEVAEFLDDIVSELRKETVDTLQERLNKEKDI